MHWRAATVLVLASVTACGSSGAPRNPRTVEVNPGLKEPAKAERLRDALAEGALQAGKASWYGPKFHGRLTANGERYDMDGLSAAHKTLPFDTRVEVHNLDNGKTLEVRINDRGPFIRGRILDLSRGAAKKLGLIGPGVANITLRVVSWPQGKAAARSAAPAGRWVQAGAFRERDRAQALAADLAPHDARFAVFSDGGWHRVQARLDTAQQAKDLLRLLRRQGISAVRVEP